jgi:hypothetical protein
MAQGMRPITPLSRKLKWHPFPMMNKERHGKIRGSASSVTVINDVGEKLCIGERSGTVSDKTLTRLTVLAPVSPTLFNFLSVIAALGS